MSLLHGVIAPIPTPLTRTDRLDPLALHRHLRWLADEGANGALILGSNGEFPSFTLVERVQIAEAAAASGADLQLVLNVGSCAIGEVREMLDAAARFGYSAVLCPPPFYFANASPQGLAAFFAQLLDHSQLPVLLYHIPQVTGVPFTDQVLNAIGEHPNLAGVKDSTGDPAELQRLRARFRHGMYLVGNDRLVATCVEAGGDGSITVVADVAPGLVGAVQADGSRQPRLTDVRVLLEEYGQIAAAKAILAHRSFGDYSTRPPQQGLDGDLREELIKRFTALVGD